MQNMYKLSTCVVLEYRGNSRRFALPEDLPEDVGNYLSIWRQMEIFYFSLSLIVINLGMAYESTKGFFENPNFYKDSKGPTIMIWKNSFLIEMDKNIMNSRTKVLLLLLWNQVEFRIAEGISYLISRKEGPVSCLLMHCIRVDVDWPKSTLTHFHSIDFLEVLLVLC